MDVLVKLYKAWRRLDLKLYDAACAVRNRMELRAARCRIGQGAVLCGPLDVVVEGSGRIEVGDRLRVNSGERYNRIGREQRCLWRVGDGALLQIGHAVGMSGTAIVCFCEVEIGDRTMIGGGTVIYDTDFHALDPHDRKDSVTDRLKRKSAPVHIGQDVFIGAHATILKGVTIGDRAIVGAGAVVTHDIPAGEVWAGNPARPIKTACRNKNDDDE